MSIATSLTALHTAKEAIKNAIVDKGGTVASGDGFADFAADIATIPTGSSYYNYSNILKAQGIIASPAGSIDLTDADFQGLTSITGGIFSTNAAGGNHPLRSVQTTVLTELRGMNYCKNLKYIKAENLTFGTYFAQYSGLQLVDTDNTPDFNTANTFRDNSTFKIFIIRDNRQRTATYTTMFTNTPIATGTGYIYVRPELISEYQNASIWTTFANQFRGLYIVNSEAERQEKIADSSIPDGSMIVYDGGTWDMSTLTGTKYTVKGE